MDRFYANLFSRIPQLRGLFPRELTQQKQKLLASLALAVGNLRTPEQLLGPLHELGARHVDYGALPAHYGVVRDTLLEVMREMAGWAPDDQLAEDWANVIDAVSHIMLEGHPAAQTAAEIDEMK